MHCCCKTEMHQDAYIYNIRYDAMENKIGIWLKVKILNQVGV